MNLRLWIPCILLLVIVIFVWNAYTAEGFQSGGSGSGNRLSVNDTRVLFWTIVGIETGKGGSSSGYSSELLSKVMNPGPGDTFQLVFPKYISMYALATYNKNPVAARKALLTNYDAIQLDLQNNVDEEMDKRTAFAANPQLESCKLLDKLTMSLYGTLIGITKAANDLSGNQHLAADLHTENISIQTKSACMNQGSTPSAACIALARLDEKLFPLLPAYTQANISLFTNAQHIQATIDTLLQAYMGMNCLPVGKTASLGSSMEMSIASVFSSDYLYNLPALDTASFRDTLQILSPYYVSPMIVNYISGQLIGTAEFDATLSTTDKYIKEMSKATNSIVSLTSSLESGQFFTEKGGNIINCPPGYYCPPTESMPIQCKIGYYCPAGTIDPLECPEGKKFSPIGATKEGDCVPDAPLGYYIDTTSNMVVKCPIGHYCSGGVKYACPVGTYNLKMGMGNILSCLTCPKGSYCPTTLNVYPCPIGTYNPTEGASTISKCRPCTFGHFCPRLGVIEPVPCTPGTFSSLLTTVRAPVPSVSSGGSGSGSGSKSGSGSGSATVGTMQVGAGGSCTPVAPGYYLPEEGNLTDALKAPCSAGYYCPGGTGVPQMCPAGAYCPPYSEMESGSGSGSGSGSRSSRARGSGAPGLTQPVPCPGGTYGSSGGLISSACSGRCTAGYVCPAGSTTPTTTRCPSGYYCPTGSAAGVPCPAGSYCPVGSTVNQKCPIHTYNSSAQQIDIFACKNCPAGRTCLEEGTATPSLCPRGYYCKEGLEPYICPIGTLCDAEGLTDPKPCPSNSSCTTLGLGGRLLCPAGYYSLRDQCTLCPAGKACPRTGLTENTIDTCPAGTFSLEGATSCTECAGSPGTYCPAGSSAPVPCAAPAGSYCPGGRLGFAPCPTGFVCPGGSTVPLSACPPDSIVQGSTCYTPPKNKPCNAGDGTKMSDGQYYDIIPVGTTLTPFVFTGWGTDCLSSSVSLWTGWQRRSYWSGVEPAFTTTRQALY